MPTVREFVRQAYQLISASTPTVPLHGDDLSVGITVLNQLLQSYANGGLLITIAKQTSVVVNIGQQEVVCGPPNVLDPPDIDLGRLANLGSAWLEKEGVTYPLIDESRNQFFAAYKYDPLQSLPRYVIVNPDTDVVRIRLYPAPSQTYNFNIRGKFQLPDLTANDDMSLVPQYYNRYLFYALARDLADYKGRGDAWSEKLEMRYREAYDNMVSSSEVNLSVTGDKGSMLNGAWVLRSGVFL